MDNNLVRLYEAYAQAGKDLFSALNPTPDEIESINEEVVDIGLEDLLCEPKSPTRGGSLGLLACLVYERREMIEEETDHDRDWYQENDPQSLVDSIDAANAGNPRK